MLKEGKDHFRRWSLWVVKLMDEQFQRNLQHCFGYALAKCLTMEPDQIMPDSTVMSLICMGGSFPRAAWRVE